MSPELRARITARNETAAGFAAVKRDAAGTADVVAASADRAAAAINRQNAALAGAASASRMAAFQQRNLAFQLNDVAVSLASGMNPLMVAMQQGSQISTIYGPEEGGLGRALQETGKMAAGLATRLLPVGLAVGAVTAGFAGMTTEINRNQEQQVSIGDVMMATWKLASESIMEDLAPITGWFADLWNTISPYLASAMNFVIGGFDLAYRDIKTIWAGLPAAVGDVVFQTAEGAVNGVIYMIRGVQVALNDMITDVNATFKTQFSTFDLMDYVKLGNPFAGGAGDLASQLGQNASDVAGTDYMKAIGDAAAGIAKARAETEGLGEALGKLPGAAQTASGAMGATGDSFLGVIGQLTGALGGLFEDNKAFAIANIAIDTGSAIMKTLGQGGAWALPQAIAMGAVGAAQMAKVLATQPGSASTPGVSGGGGGVVAAPAAAARRSVGGTIVVHGDSFGLGSIEGLVKGITEMVNADAGTDLVLAIQRASR